MALLTGTASLNILAGICASESQKESLLLEKASSSLLNHKVPSTISTNAVDSQAERIETNNGVSDDDEEEATHPVQFLEKLFARHNVRLGGRRCTKKHLSVKANTSSNIVEDQDAYDMEVTMAVRNGNLPKLKELHQTGYSMDASNRFGESLLHISCRRGHTAMVKFMVQEAKINPRVMDDMGRTALHDCCWSTQPNLDTMDVLLQVMPPVSLLMQDTRGNTPFDYAPRKHWGIWLKYLQEREHVFVNWIVSRRRLVAARAAAAQMEAQAKRRVEREQDYMVQLQQRIASSSSSSSSSLSVPSSSVSSLLGRTIRLD